MSERPEKFRIRSHADHAELSLGSVTYAADESSAVVRVQLQELANIANATYNQGKQEAEAHHNQLREAAAEVVAADRGGLDAQAHASNNDYERMYKALDNLAAALEDEKVGPEGERGPFAGIEILTDDRVPDGCVGILHDGELQMFRLSDGEMVAPEGAPEREEAVESSPTPEADGLLRNIAEFQKILTDFSCLDSDDDHFAIYERLRSLNGRLAATKEPQEAGE